MFRQCARGVSSYTQRTITSTSHPSKLVEEFKNRIDSNCGSTSREENMPEFLGPAILNALGLAAFNYDFRDDGEERKMFGASLRDFMWVMFLQSVSRTITSLGIRAKGFGTPSDWKVLCQGVMVHVPPRILDAMIYLPTSGLTFLRRHVQLSNQIARRLIRSRSSRVDNVDKDALTRIRMGVSAGTFLSNFVQS